VLGWADPSGGSMVYPGAGIALSTGSAWTTSITNNSANWNTAYIWGNHASAGYVTTSTEGWRATDVTAIASPIYNDSGTLKIYQASSSQGGYLDMADWSTFNNKATGAWGSDTTYTTPNTLKQLTINGTTWYVAVYDPG